LQGGKNNTIISDLKEIGNLRDKFKKCPFVIFITSGIFLDENEVIISARPVIISIIIALQRL